MLQILFENSNSPWHASVSDLRPHMAPLMPRLAVFGSVRGRAVATKAAPLEQHSCGPAFAERHYLA